MKAQYHLTHEIYIPILLLLKHQIDQLEYKQLIFLRFSKL